MDETIALIPAYEPTPKLVPLVRRLALDGCQIVVVDDGSGEEYAGIFKAAADFAHVISYSPNAGKGEALKRGYSYIRESGMEGIVVTLDSDGQHAIDDVARVVARAKENPGALTLGVRSFGAGTPARSRMGNGITRLVYKTATGHDVSDTQTGLRAFGTELLGLMGDIEGERYEYEINVLMRCEEDGIDVVEMSIATIYEDGNKGSHFQTVRDSLLIYREIVKFVASSFVCFLIDYGLFGVLALLTGGLGAAVSVPLSNVAARVVSATTNFAINRRYVFESEKSVFETAVRYFALAAVILAGNTAMLGLLVMGTGMNEFLAKIVTEISFFVVSYAAQRFWIFRTGGEQVKRTRKRVRPVL